MHFKTVQYARVSAVLVEGFKEQQQVIEDQQRDLALIRRQLEEKVIEFTHQQSQLTTLRQEVDELKALVRELARRRSEEA